MACSSNSTADFSKNPAFGRFLDSGDCSLACSSKIFMKMLMSLFPGRCQRVCQLCQRFVRFVWNMSGICPSMWGYVWDMSGICQGVKAVYQRHIGNKSADCQRYVRCACDGRFFLTRFVNYGTVEANRSVKQKRILTGFLPRFTGCPAPGREGCI